MLLLAFTDTHSHDLSGIKAAIAKHRPRLAVCVGDFTIFGSHAESILKDMDDLGVPVVLIHGNHESGVEIERIVRSCENIFFAHGKVVEVEGLRFFGYGGNGFRSREPQLEALAAQAEIDEKTIVLCHAPPFGTRLDEVEEDWHVGSESLRDIILRYRPMLVLAGHIHECFHTHDRLGGATLINPGPDGELIEVHP